MESLSGVAGHLSFSLGLWRLHPSPHACQAQDMGTWRTTGLSIRGKEGIKYLSLFLILYHYISPHIH